MNNYKQIETEPNFLSLSDPREDFKFKFASNSFINQYLIDKNYTNNIDGVTVYATRLTALDPTIWNLALDIPTPTTKMYLKFPISNGEFHSTHEILSDSLTCTVSSHDTKDYNISDIVSSHDTDDFNFLTLINSCVQQLVSPVPPHLVTLINVLFPELVQNFIRFKKQSQHIGNPNVGKVSIKTKNMV